MKNIFALIIAATLLSGCAGLQSAVNAVLHPGQNTVATIESTLAAADHAAILYLKLPSCINHHSPCRDPVITKKIDTYSKAAYAAVKTARANENATTVEAADNAVNAYKTITDILN